MFQSKVKNQLNGFSLLEVIVALGIFSIIMLAVTAIFQMSLISQRNAIGSQNVQESLRYAFEIMSKEMRMAEKDDGSCASVGEGIVYAGSGANLYFKNQDGQCVHYYLDNSRMAIDRAGNIAYVTPKDITITSLSFAVNNGDQPFVTINVGVKLKIGQNSEKTVNLQTSVSSRNYEWN